MTSRDVTVHVPAIRAPKTIVAYWLTEAGEDALAASELWGGHDTPTEAMPREVAAEATILARQRRDQLMTGDPPFSL